MMRRYNNIPSESEAYPEVPAERESANSIESCVDDFHNNLTNSADDSAVDEETHDFIQKIMAHMGLPMNDEND
jgi:hypothetical protein